MIRSSRFSRYRSAKAQSPLLEAYKRNEAELEFKRSAITPQDQFIKAYRDRCKSASSSLADYRTTLPQRNYVDDDVYSKELKTIWSNNWLFGCFTNQLQCVGSYVTVNYDKESVILLRDHTNTIRGYHNICRHRGSRLLDQEEGSKECITCPYHRWTYDLGGKLISAKNLEDQIRQ